MLFGVSAFSAASFSSAAGAVYSESVTIAASSSITSNAIRYAIAASATMPSTSSLSCYSIRYAFAGATIVGESDSDVNAVRYTLGSAQIGSESAIAATSSVLLETQVSVVGESAFSASCIYISQPIMTFECASGLVINARKKWENESDTSESWSAISDNSETWTPISNTSESWTRIN